MFRATAQRLIQYIGSTKLQHLPAEWQSPVNTALESIERAVCLSISLTRRQAAILTSRSRIRRSPKQKSSESSQRQVYVQHQNNHQGFRGRPHKSTDDKDDPEDVVSVRLKDAQDKRVDTIHIHKDGTSKQKSKRA